MATLLAIKHLAVLLFFALGCNAVPDQFQLGYGQSWAHAGQLWDHHNSFTYEAGNAQMAWAALTWDLGPRQVAIVDGDIPDFHLRLDYTPQEPVKVPTTLPSGHAATDHLSDQLREGVAVFNKMEFGKSVALLMIVAVFLWIFRKQIGRLIPRFGNGNNKK